MQTFTRKISATHEQLHAETLEAARKEKSATMDLLRFLNSSRNEDI